MIIVSDTSPIANLILIDRLDILEQIFGNVIVPNAVDIEIKALKRLGRNIESYENAEWIEVKTITDEQAVATLKQTLDDGEAEAITLAIETNCSLLLIDERLGTNVARQKGLQTVGLLGVLIKAKHNGLIISLKDILRELKTKAGFWIGEQLENKILLENE